MLGRTGPGLKLRQKHALDHRGGAGAMVFPREVIIPTAPARLMLARGRLLAGEAEIADRDDVLSGTAAIPVGESIELLDIAGRQPGLPLDPGAQPRLQRTMGEFARTGWERGSILGGEATRT